MSGKPPAFQFYAKDFLTGTMEMSLLEIGAYTKLLAWSWDNGPVPIDDRRRAVILGVSIKSLRLIWGGIADKWVEKPGGYVNERLERQRDALATYLTEQRLKGKRGAQKRWSDKNSHGDSNGHESANGQVAHGLLPDGSPEDSSAVSDLQTPEKPKPDREVVPTPQLFALFDAEHRKRFDDAPAEFDRPKDAGIFANVWRRRGTEETEWLIRAFFATKDRWIIQAGFTVGVWKTQIPKLISQRPRVVKPTEHWSDECKRVHGGRCTSPRFHAAMMAAGEQPTV